MGETETEVRLEKKIRLLQGQINNLGVQLKRLHGQITHPSVLARVRSEIDTGVGTNFLKLDQTVPQTVHDGSPIFQGGLTIGPGFLQADCNVYIGLLVPTDQVQVEHYCDETSAYILRSALHPNYSQFAWGLNTVLGYTFLQSNAHGTGTALPISFWVGADRIIDIISTGVSIGGTAVRGTTVGTKSIQIFDGTTPAGTLVNGCSLYSAAGKLYAMDAAGNVYGLTSIFPATYAIGDLLYADSVTTLARLSDVAVNSVLLSGGVGIAPAYGKVALAAMANMATGSLLGRNTGGVGIPEVITDIPTAITIGTAYIYRVGGTDVAVADGGTNISAYAVGDLLQASAATTLTPLAAVATGNVLLSGGIATVSTWGKIGLTTHVSGILPVANGGTGQNALNLVDHGAFGGLTDDDHTQYIRHSLGAAIGDLLVASGIGVFTALSDVAVNNVLLSGGVGVVPAYGKLPLAAMADMATGALLGRNTALTGIPEVITDIPTTITIGGAYVYRASGTDVAVADGGTNISSYAVGDILYASGTTTLSKLADVAAGAYLRSGGVTTAPLWSTLILPNAATAFRLPVATAANAIGELAAVGATGEYLKGNTGAIPSWATLNQAAVAGLTTADGPTFAHLHISDLAAITTAAESWVGPSSTTGIYFKGGFVGIGTVSPTGKLDIVDSREGDDAPVRLTNNGSTNFMQSYWAMAPNLSAGEHVSGYAVGTTFTNKNAGYMAFYNAGAGSTDNRLGFGFHSVDDILNITAAGNVGIGTTPAVQFHTTGAVRLANFGAGTATFDASGNISSVSDERLKNIQGKYTGGIAQLNGIEPIIHKWNKKSGMEMDHEYVGFSAQNVQENMPEAVYENKDGYLSYSDKAIIAALVNTVKQQQIQIEALQARLN